MILNEQSKSEISDENDNEFKKVRKVSKFFSYTINLNFLIVWIAGALFLFYLTFQPKTGFVYFLIFFVYLSTMLGVRHFDNISRILLLLINLAIGAVLFKVIQNYFLFMIYFVITVLTFYTLIFDNKTRKTFDSSFKKNQWKLDVLILLNYIYLIYIAFLNLQILNTESQFLIFYIFVAWIFVNLVSLQLLKANARTLMFITSPLIIIYSFIVFQTNIIGIYAIIVNVLTLVILLFDKETKKLFKKVDLGTYYFFRTTIFVNIAALIFSVIGLLSMYSQTLDQRYLLFGIFFIPFYGLSIFEIRKYSKIWKNILSLAMVILLVSSVILFNEYIVMAVIFLPTALINLFTFNLDFSTSNLFVKNETQYQHHHSILKNVHFHLI